MDLNDDAKALWLSKNILPNEDNIRRIIASWRLPTDLDTEDIIQESYAKIASLDSLEHISSPRAYFLQVARSILLMHVRRAKLISIEVIADFDQSHAACEAPSQEIVASDRQQLRLLSEAVARMGEPNRSIFVLRLIQELSHREIGEKVGLSENAVQKVLAKTLISLALEIGRVGKAASCASTLLDSKGDRQPWR